MRFTVLTPTYNRRHTLGGVYESLCAQTFRDFEWIIVDDGSTDKTRELVEPWKTFFPIRYVWKPNGGKHTAVNLGVSLAQGEFVQIFDSDDRCTVNALERFDHHWRQIPDMSRFSTISSLCCTTGGNVVGEPYPADYVDALTFADQVRYSKWERWRMDRTSVLRDFPFPEGERFVPDSLAWNRISQKYAARFINEALRIYEPNLDGITHKRFLLRASSPRATLTHYRELAVSTAPAPMRLRAALNFCRFALIAKLPRLFLRHLLGTESQGPQPLNSKGA